MNIVIFGPPGAGKGTQSNFIVKNFKLHQLSTGELLRKEINNNTELGQQISSIINEGNLVSDKIVGDLIEKYVFISGHISLYLSIFLSVNSFLVLCSCSVCILNCPTWIKSLFLGISEEVSK